MKDYVKPEFFYESFELNMSVAANCAVIANHYDPGACIVTSGINWGSYAAGDDVVGDTTTEYYCWTAGADGMFTS